jgi:hypothetical protein
MPSAPGLSGPPSTPPPKPLSSMRRAEDAEDLRTNLQFAPLHLLLIRSARKTDAEPRTAFSSTSVIPTANSRAEHRHIAVSVASDSLTIAHTAILF